MRKGKINILLGLLLAMMIVMLSACNKEKKLGWEAEYLAPLVNADLSLTNLVGDSILQSDANNLLYLIFSNQVYSFNLADYAIEIPDTGIGSAASLDSFNIGEQKFNLTITLGSLCKELIATGDITNVLIGNSIISSNGDSMVFPGLAGIAVPADTFDASFVFEEVNLYHGVLYGWIHNEFPVPLENVQYQLRNKVGGELIVSDTIPYIAPHDSVYKEYDLSGKRIEGAFWVELQNFDTPGSSGQKRLVDTSDYIKLDMKAAGLRASSATAVFPSAELITTTEEITHDLGDTYLTYIEAKSGNLNIYLSSSVAEGVYLKYTLDGAFDDKGQPLTVTTFLPPAPVGGVSSVTRSFDLSGYSMTLTGKNHDKFNTYTQTISATIDSSGYLRTITSADSIRFSYSITNIVPRYIRGYAGKDTILVGPETVPFDVLSKIQAGSLDLDQVNVGLSLKNGIGVTGEVLVHQLSAVKGGATRTLIAPSVIDNPIRVERALDFPIRPTYTSLALNNTNSNIDELLELLPDQLAYNIEIFVNPDGNDMRYRDFISDQSNLDVNLDVEVPLSLIANNLTLIDTIDFSLGGGEEDVQAISDGKINLIAYNSYPLEAQLKLIVFDEYDNIIDTLINNYTIKSAHLGADCRTTDDRKIVQSIDISKDRLNRLLLGKKAIVKASFSTPALGSAENESCNGHIKIYSDYHLRLKLTGDFKLDFGDN